MTVDPAKSVDGLAVPGAEGDLPARLYRPDEAGPLPTVVLFHGGARMRSRRFDGMTHGFDRGAASAAARDAVVITCGLFAEVLHP